MCFGSNSRFRHPHEEMFDVSCSRPGAETGCFFVFFAILVLDEISLIIIVALSISYEIELIRIGSI